MKTYVIIPLFNEEKNIESLVREIAEVHRKIDFNLVLINDGSYDKTGEFINNLSRDFNFIESIHHDQNRGWAGALKTGIEYSLAHGADIIMTMDGDFTHDPKYIPYFIKEIENGADIVVGSRFVLGGGMVGIPRERIWLSSLSNLIFRLTLNLGVKDLTSGYRAHLADVLRNMTIESEGFQINLEMILKVKKQGCKIIEIPIKIYPRKAGTSSRKILKEIPKYLAYILKIKLTSLIDVVHK